MGAFDDLIPNNSASTGGAFEDLIPGNKKKKKEDQEQGRTVADVVGDIGVTALKGAVGLNQSITGLADLVSGGRAGKALEDLGFDQKQAQDLLAKAYSEPQQRANQKVSQADGFLDTLLTALENPSTIATTVGESLPLMLGGAGVARGIMGATTKVPAWLAGAVGEGVVGAGSAAEGVRTETADGLLSPGQALAAGASGVGTAAFGALGGKVAQKLGIGDVDTMLAQGAANAAKSDKNFVRQILEAGISESVFEEMPQSAQEQMWQNYALGKPIMEGVGGATAMGGLAGFAMGGVGGGFNAAMGGKQSNDIDTLLAELQRQAKQASAAPSPAPTANVDQGNLNNAIPQASQAPVQSPALQAQDLDPELRLAELELIAGQRTLNPQETEEWQTLNAQLDAMDAQAPQDGTQEQTEPQAEPPSNPQASVNSADAPQVPSQSPEVVPTTPEPALIEQPSAAPPLPENQTNQGQLPSNVDGNLQNRDRARLASVRQMAEIANNPDYLRLGPSRTPDSGAPMVFPVQDDLTNIPTENIGASDLAVMADGQQVPFNYAVVEAGTVQPSNFADGRANPDFNSNVAGTVKALNNGRTAGIRAAYEQGTADQYRAGLSQEAERLGLNPQVVARMKQPMLVRLYSDSSNTAGMAAKSQAQGLGMSPGELARQDAPLLDASVLGVYAGGDVASAENRDFVRGFVGKLAGQGQDIAGMMTERGELSPGGRARIQAALMQSAYGNSDLVSEMFDSLDTDIKAIGEALKTNAGAWANMRDSAKQGVINPETDITGSLTQAIELVKKARRDKASLFDLVNQPDLMTGEAPDPMTVGVLRLLYTGKHMTRAVGKDKLTKALDDYLKAAMASQAGPDMFGEQVTPQAILQTLTGETNAATTQGQGQPSSGVNSGNNPDQSGQAGQRPINDRGGREPIAGGAGQSQIAGTPDSTANPAGNASPTSAEQVNTSEPERPAFDLNQPTPDELAAIEVQRQKLEREQKEAERKAQADSQVDDFRLTGSDRPVDLAEAAGQTNLFDAPEETTTVGVQFPEVVQSEQEQDSIVGDQTQNNKEADSPKNSRFARLANVFGMESTETQAVVDDAVRNWVNAPNVVVVQDMQDQAVPEAVRAEDARQKSSGATGEPRGFFYQGKVWLVAGQMRNERDVIETLAHETLGHFGLRGMFGDALDGILAQLHQSRPDLTRAKAKEYGLDLKTRDGRMTAAEEVLAHLAQAQPQLGYVKRAVAAIRTWLRENIPGFKNLKLTDAEIINNFIVPARNWVQRGERSRQHEPVLAFSRSTASVTQSPAFKAWFGKSQVVDEAGNPMVVYHGTKSDVTEFKNGAGSDSNFLYGKEPDSGGFYFVERPESADDFLTDFGPTFNRGANLMPVYLSAQNMARINMADYLTLEKQASKLRELKGQGFDGAIIDNGSYQEYVVFSPSQIKSAIGNNGQFDASTSDIRFSRTSLNGNTPPVQNNWWGRQKQKVHDLLDPERIDTILYNMQDKFIDLKRLRAHIQELNGTITDLNDAYQGEELYHKRLASRIEEFHREELKPLLAAMSVRGVRMEELEKHLHALHAKEANKELANRNPNQAMVDKGVTDAQTEVKNIELALQKATAQGQATKAIEESLQLAKDKLKQWRQVEAFKGTEAERNSLSGMTDAQADAILAAYSDGKAAAMKALTEMVRAFQESTLKKLEEYGLETRDTLKAWRNAYSDYVPLYRDEENAGSRQQMRGRGFSIRGSSSKRRTGSNKEVTNILSHIVMQREAALTRGEKNRVAKQLYVMAKQNPDSKIWSIDKPPKVRQVDEKTGFVKTVTDPAYRNRDNVVMTRIAGRDTAIVFNEDSPELVRLARAIKNMDVSDLGVTLTWVGKFTRYFSAINTQYNIVFGAINFLRDYQAGILNLSTTQIADKKAQVMKDTWHAMRAIYRGTREKEYATHGILSSKHGQLNKVNQEWMDLWEDMQLNGGTTGFRDLFATPQDRTKAIEKTLKDFESGNVKKSINAAFKWLSDYNETAENAVRLAAYKAALDKGLSKQKAASLAKNLTVNFNRKGAHASSAGAMYAFFNAAVQGTARLVETLAGPMGRKIMLGGVAIGFIDALAVMAMIGGSGDDEDGRDVYAKIPEFVRERSILIGWNKHYAAIPMPLGFHVFPNIGRMTAEWIFGSEEKSTGRRLTDMVRVVADAFNPLGSSNDPLQMVMPTILDTPLDLARNKDWTGSSIYTEDFNSLDPTTGVSRARSSASPISITLADLVNKATGGTDYRPGGWSPTPDALDYVFEQLTGGVGRELNKATKTIKSFVTGEELPAYQIPAVGRIYGNTEGVAANSRYFYDTIKHLNELDNEIKGRLKDGKDVDAVFTEFPEADLIGSGKAALKQVKGIRKELESLKREKPEGYQDDIKLRNEETLRIMQDLDRMLKEAKRQAN